MSGHKRQTNFRLPPDTILNIGLAAKSLGITKTEVVERAIKEFVVRNDLKMSVKIDWSKIDESTE